MRFVSCLAVLAMLLSGSTALAQAAVSSEQATWTRKVQQHLLDQIDKAKLAARAVFEKARSYGMTGEVRVCDRLCGRAQRTDRIDEGGESSGSFEIDGVAEQSIARAGPVPAISLPSRIRCQAFTTSGRLRGVLADKSKQRSRPHEPRPRDEARRCARRRPRRMAAILVTPWNVSALARRSRPLPACGERSMRASAAGEGALRSELLKSPSPRPSPRRRGEGARRRVGNTSAQRSIA